MDSRIKILVVTVCRNESAIMGWFLRHYSFADAVHVWHNSCDGECTTHDERFAEEYGQVEPVHVKNYFYDTGGVMRDDLNVFIKNAHYHLQHGFDWVIVVDMDEFLWAKEGVREYLQRCTENGITLPRTMGYNMVGDCLPISDGGYVVESDTVKHIRNCRHFNLTDLIQEGVTDPMYSKFCAFQSSVRIAYGAGAHPHDTRVIMPNGEVKLAGEVSETLSPELKLLHYRWWGEEHTRAKAMGNKLSDVNIANGWGLEATDADGMVARYRELRAQRRNVFEETTPPYVPAFEENR